MTSTFYKSFLNTFLFNLATVAAIVVGVVSYAYYAVRLWYAENGEQLRTNVSFQLAEFFSFLHFKFANLSGEFND